MDSLGIYLVVCVILIISFLEYRNGANTYLFKDKTEIEINNRKIQLLESQIKLKQLESKLRDIENDTK